MCDSNSDYYSDSTARRDCNIDLNADANSHLHLDSHIFTNSIPNINTKRSSCNVYSHGNSHSCTNGYTDSHIDRYTKWRCYRDLYSYAYRN